MSRDTKIASIETSVNLMREDVTELKGEMKNVNAILAIQEENLRQHIQGVKLAREQNDILRKDVDARLNPIQEHVIQVRFLGKMMLVFVAFPAAVYYVAQIVRIIMGKI